MFLDINDLFIVNYLEYHFGIAELMTRGRLRNHFEEWKKIKPPAWILSLVYDGLYLPFYKEPPIMMLPNNKSAMLKENLSWVGETIQEYLKLGHVKQVFCPQQ